MFVGVVEPTNQVGRLFEEETVAPKNSKRTAEEKIERILFNVVALTILCERKGPIYNKA